MHGQLSPVCLHKHARQIAMHGEVLQKQLHQRNFQRRPRDTFQTLQQNASNPLPATLPFREAHSYNSPQSIVSDSESDGYEEIINTVSSSSDNDNDSTEIIHDPEKRRRQGAPRWDEHLTQAMVPKLRGNRYTSTRITSNLDESSSKPPFSPETSYMRKVKPAERSKPQPPARGSSKQSLNQGKPLPPVRQSSLSSNDNTQVC